MDAESDAVPEKGFDLLAQVSGDEEDVRYTAAPQRLDLPLQDGLAGDGYHGLGDLIVGDGAQAGTLAAGHNDCLHHRTASTVLATASSLVMEVLQPAAWILSRL